jgi:hypothetical protein
MRGARATKIHLWRLKMHLTIGVIVKFLDANQLESSTATYENTYTSVNPRLLLAPFLRIPLDPNAL